VVADLAAEICDPIGRSHTARCARLYLSREMT
jgi:hypothetical protein